MKFGKSMLLAAFLAVGGAVAADEAKADIGVWTNVPAGIENKSITGVRFGLPCSISKGVFQLGFFNNCYDDAMFQVGLIKINKNGWLPFMVFVNFGSDTFK